MKTVGQIYFFPMICFLIYETKNSCLAAHMLSYTKKIDEYTQLKHRNTNWQNTIVLSKLIAQYWSYRLKTKILCSQQNHPIMLLEKCTFEDRIYCKILTDEIVGWISYDKEEDLPFFTENTNKRK